MLDTIVNVILPIFAVMAVGWFYGRTFKPDRKVISSLIIYVFAPALVIEGLANVNVGGESFIKAGILTFGVAIILTVVCMMIARGLQFNLRTENAFIVSVILFNGANYGLPFNLFVFGPEAENVAVLYYSLSVIVTNTIGIYILSRGDDVNTRQAMGNIFRIPLFYAAIIGVVLNLLGVRVIPDAAAIPADVTTIPVALARVIDVLAAGTIPAMLILIGVQMSDFRLNVEKIKPILIGTALTLIGAPLLTVGIAGLLDMQTLVSQVGIVQHAMPTAVIASALATQFDSDGELVAGTLVLSTGLSVLTLSLLVQII